MQIVNVSGYEQEVPIPVVSFSKDPKSSKGHQHNGVINFVETVFSHNGKYFASLACTLFQVDFFGYKPLNVQLNYSVETAGPTYHHIRVWLEAMKDKVARDILVEHPQISLYDKQGQPEHEPEDEIKEKAFLLYQQAAKQESVNRDATPMAAPPESVAVPVEEEEKSEKPKITVQKVPANGKSGNKAKGKVKASQKS